MKIRAGAILAAMVAMAGTADAEDFSCSFGQGACLQYGDTVCSSGGKCVQQDAQCFSPLTCGYGGFVCKSDLDDLQTKARSLATDYDELVNKYNSLVDSSQELAESYDRAKRCVRDAATLEEAQECQF
jgi:hypothetical protein